MVEATNLEILDKPPEERDKMLGSPNISWYGFLEQIIREG